MDFNRFNEEDFDNGYSRNLLWRLWHASWAFEMEHLSEKCGKVCKHNVSYNYLENVLYHHEKLKSNVAFY